MRTKAPNSADGIGAVLTPRPASLSRVDGMFEEFIAGRIELLDDRLRCIGRREQAVPDARLEAGHGLAQRRKIGVRSLRVGEVTPMPRSVLPWICGMAREKSANETSITPPITSVMACGTPR